MVSDITSIWLGNNGSANSPPLAGFDNGGFFAADAPILLPTLMWLALSAAILGAKASVAPLYSLISLPV